MGYIFLVHLPRRKILYALKPNSIVYVCLVFIFYCSYGDWTFRAFHGRPWADGTWNTRTPALKSFACWACERTSQCGIVGNAEGLRTIRNICWHVLWIPEGVYIDLRDADDRAPGSRCVLNFLRYALPFLSERHLAHPRTFDDAISILTVRAHVYQRYLSETFRRIASITQRILIKACSSRRIWVARVEPRRPDVMLISQLILPESFDARPGFIDHSRWRTDQEKISIRIKFISIFSLRLYN